MSPQEIEELHNRFRRMMPIRDYTTMRTTNASEFDGILESYMQSGFSRKEALIKFASERGIEIRTGLHIPPTMDDALYELEEERKRAELARLAKVREEEATPSRLYERLQYTYRFICGSGAKRVLDEKIESYVKKGLSREEAIRKLAKKEGLM